MVIRGIAGLRRHLRAQGIRWRLPFGGIFPLDLTGDAVDATVFVRAEPVRGVTVATRCLPVGPAAVAVHEGSYDALPCTYQVVFNWIQQSDYEPAGPVVEEYLSIGTRPSGNSPRTRLLVPLAG